MPITSLQTYRYYILYSGLLILALGIVVVVGWLADIGFLKTLAPGYVSMKFNTALCFILLGISVITYLKFSHKGTNKLSMLLALTVFLLGLTTILQQLFNYNLNIDQLFISDLSDQASHVPYPGRMSPFTGICFSCTGMGIVIINTNVYKKYYNIIAQFFFHITTFIAYIALLGYFFKIDAFYHFSFVNSMALHTAVAFLIISVALTFLNPTLGVTGIFTGDMIGNRVARRLFTKMFIALTCIGFLSMSAHRNRWVSTQINISLIIISFVIICMLLLWKKSVMLNNLARKEKVATDNFKMSVQCAPYALVIANTNGTILHINPETEKMYGYDSEELIGKDFKLILPKKVHSIAQDIKNSFFSAPAEILFNSEDDVVALRKNGTEFPVEITLTPIITDDEIKVLASIVDITARKSNENIIKQQLIQLQQKNQELEQFNYIASHDLQQPLRTVANYITLLQEDYPEQINDEIKAHLAVMSASTTRMSILIRSLLDFGKLGRNKKLALTDCQTVVNNVVTDLTSLVKSNGAKVTVSGKLPVLYAYETELHQLFQNLINNAIKFSKKNVPPEIIISCKRIKGFYEFSVADNGIGIEPLHTARIFNIFQRLHKEEEYEGYGIGLANCRKIAEIHGGRIWAESEIGHGSTFKFTILNFKL